MERLVNHLDTLMLLFSMIGVAYICCVVAAGEFFKYEPKYPIHLYHYAWLVFAMFLAIH